MSRSTIKDVAKLAGVTAMTVSRVINNSGYVKDETRARVEEAISKLNYVPNKLGNSLRFNETKTIALLLHEIVNPFWLIVLQGVEQAASEQGFQVIVSNTFDPVKQFELLKNILSKQVDGVLLSPIQSDIAPIEFAKQQNVPLVLMDHRIPEAEVDTVRADSIFAATRLVQHLIDLGHERIAMVSGPEYASTAVDRVTGYRCALERANLPVDETMIYHGHYTIESGYDMTKKLLAARKPPSAICVANNALAMGAWKALKEAGLEIPKDISMVAFDFRRPPLFSVEEPFFTMAASSGYEMGRQATQLLLKRIRSKKVGPVEEIILPTEIIINRSTAIYLPSTGDKDSWRQPVMNSPPW